MGKLAIWIITVVGLMPSVAVAVLGAIMLTDVSRLAVFKRYPSSHVYVHDSYFEVAGWRIDFTPQYWSVTLLFIGIVMIVVALTAILRS